MRVGASFCPGIVHAVPARDGLLLRVRVPGGLLLAGQLGAVAALSSTFGDGQIEITSRANLQLRGIGTQDLPQVVAALSEGRIASVAGRMIVCATSSPARLRESIPTNPSIRVA